VLLGLRPKSVNPDETVTSELLRRDAIITLLPVNFSRYQGDELPRGAIAVPDPACIRGM